jgi:hypothetical protein
MSLALRTDFGCTEAIIDDDCGYNRFHEIAEILTDSLDIQFSGKVEEPDTIYWTFQYKGFSLTLHYNIYTGVSIYPSKFREAQRKENDAVVELASFLEKKLLVHHLKKYVA